MYIKAQTFIALWRYKGAQVLTRKYVTSKMIARKACRGNCKNVNTIFIGQIRSHIRSFSEDNKVVL